MRTAGGLGVWVGAILFASAVAPPQARATSDQPNIILIVADDLGWNDVGYHGSDLSTPRIDELVRRGVELNQFYTQPTCTPTRSALMTGRYPMRYGMHARVSRWWHSKGLPLNERLLPETLRELGYKTAICGKWHLGMAGREYLPLARGFDHQYDHLGGGIDYFQHTASGSLDWHRNQHPLKESGYATKLIGDEAVRLLESHDDSKPLFLYLPFNAPHAPQQAPAEAIEDFASIDEPGRRVYAAMVSELDKAIGRVVEAVENRGEAKQTLIWFFSDNGGATNTAASNVPLRGHKGQLYEGGVRVPAFVCWEGTIDAGVVIETPLHVVDVSPTLIRLAGGDPNTLTPIDGQDAWPAIRRSEEPKQRTILINARRRRGAVRRGDWKLVRNGEADVSPPVVELFDLRNDPNEQRNLAADRPRKVAELLDDLDAMAAREHDPDGLEVRTPLGVVAPKVWDFSNSETGGATRPAVVKTR